MNRPAVQPGHERIRIETYRPDDEPRPQYKGFCECGFSTPTYARRPAAAYALKQHQAHP